MSVLTDSIPESGSTIGRNVKSAIHEHRFFLLACVTFYVTAFVFLNATIGYAGAEYFTEIFAFFLRSAMVFGGAALGIHIVLRLYKERPSGSPIKFIYEDLSANVFGPENRWRIFFGLLGFSVTMSAFLVLKASIPKVFPFAYDLDFEALDRYLHFGYQPWELLQPIMGYTYVTLAVQQLYYFWFFVFFVTFFWQISSRSDNKLRLQFITSFVLCWSILGGLMATTLSSAGPIFFDRVLPNDPNPYSSAMGYLQSIHNEHDMFMFYIKETLWFNHLHAVEGDVVKGISAMPSMHVSIAFLLALFGWRKSRAIGIAYTLFFVAILLGSVHLLWHYAIDGYVSILGTWLIWIGCGKYYSKTSQA